MSDGQGGSEGGAAPSAVASAESGSGISSGVEATASPITPESPIQAGEISDEATLDNATGVPIADNIINTADKSSAEDTLNTLATGGNIGDKPQSETINEAAFSAYDKNNRANQAEDAEQTIEPNKIDTNTPQNTKDQTTTDETQKPQDKKPEAEGEKPPDGENEDKKDETPEDPKSEKEKQIEEKMQMADIVSQIKDINPDFDPKNPEAQDFLKNLAENPDQMNTAADTLKMLGEQKTVLENSDALKNLGIDPKDLVAPAAMGTLKALSDTIEKAMKELAGKPNKTKEEEDKNKKDGFFLLLLKALGLMLAAGSAAALTVGKEIQKK